MSPTAPPGSRPLLAAWFAALAALAVPAAGAAQQSTFAEGFDGGSNTGGWTWGTGNEGISPLNGNPGPFLRDATLFTCCPLLSTAPGPFPGAGSIFSGDYRAMGVTSVGLDLVTLWTSFGMGERPLTVMLRNENGTPLFFDDDWGAYFVGTKEVPGPGVTESGPPGWTSFDFEIPSASTELPPGWVLFGPGGHTWNDVITQVDQLQFHYGDPAGIFLFIDWDVGLDNPRITFADCDGNGVPDTLDIAAGTLLDLDGDGVPDVCQALSADVATVSTGQGGTQVLALHAGSAHAGQIHFVAGSLSGTAPGLPLGSALLPLNPDVYFSLTVNQPNQPPLLGGLGLLDAAGQATAAFTLPGGLGALAGLTVHHAYVAIDPATSTVALASNAIPVRLVP